MTKKHFKRFAAVLALSRPDGLGDPRWQQWVADVEVVADVCAEFNPNFDHKRFREACNA